MVKRRWNPGRRLLSRLAGAWRSILGSSPKKKTHLPCRRFCRPMCRKNTIWVRGRVLCPPSKNRHKIALKNGMNLNNSFVFAKTSAFIPRFTWQRASADMMMRRKNEAAPRAVRPGTSLSYRLRLLIVKRLSRHKRSVNARTLSETAN